MVSIEGCIVGGGYHIDKRGQVKSFAQEFGEFGGCFPGTINVNLTDYTVDPAILKVDLITQEINPTFEFVRVLFEYPMGAKHEGWIYQPFGYHWGHDKKKNFVEIMLKQEISKPSVGDPCRLYILNNGDGRDSIVAPVSN